jgi:hypothetical protein
MIVQRKLHFKGLSVLEVIHQVMQLAVCGFHCSGCGLMYNKVP